jgi:iron(III) transport system substrate-binding protein
VLGRITSGERPVGALLLENLLSADGTVAVPIFPEDGAVLVPGPIALTAECRNERAARAIYDLVLSPKGQALIVAGDMYSPLPSMPPPEGAPPLSSLAVRPWADGLLEKLVEQQAATKERWAQ